MKALTLGGMLVVLLLAGYHIPMAMAQDMEAGRRKAEACATCHGVNGNSLQGKVPILAGQTARYTYLQLKDFKEGRRQHPVITPEISGLNQADALDLSAYFAAQKPHIPDFVSDPTKVAAGKKKSEEGLCVTCHLSGFKGQNEIPRMTGQHPEYLSKQLKDFRAKLRTNDAGNMTSIAKHLSDEDIENLAHYMRSLGGY